MSQRHQQDVVTNANQQPGEEMSFLEFPVSLWSLHTSRTESRRTQSLQVIRWCERAHGEDDRCWCGFTPSSSRYSKSLAYVIRGAHLQEVWFRTLKPVCFFLNDWWCKYRAAWGTTAGRQRALHVNMTVCGNVWEPWGAVILLLYTEESLRSPPLLFWLGLSYVTAAGQRTQYSVDLNTSVPPFHVRAQASSLEQLLFSSHPSGSADFTSASQDVSRMNKTHTCPQKSSKTHVIKPKDLPVGSHWSQTSRGDWINTHNGSSEGCRLNYFQEDTFSFFSQ